MLYPDHIPDWIKEGIDRYANDHIRLAGFLVAVLANDLEEACGRADIASAVCIWAITHYVINHTPAACHGSREAVDAWTKGRAK